MVGLCCPTTAVLNGVVSLLGCCGQHKYSVSTFWHLSISDLVYQGKQTYSFVKAVCGHGSTEGLWQCGHVFEVIHVRDSLAGSCARVLSLLLSLLLSLSLSHTNPHMHTYAHTLLSSSCVYLITQCTVINAWYKLEVISLLLCPHILQ